MDPLLVRLRPGARALACAVLFALALAAFHVQRDRARDADFEIDEAEWLTMSIHYWRQLTGEVHPEGDGRPPGPVAEGENPWMVGIHRSTFGFMNPILPKLVFGWVAVAGGATSYDRAVYPKFEKHPPRRRAAKEAVRPALDRARKVVLVLAAASALCVFVAADRVGGWIAGAAGYGLLCVSPAFLDGATRVRTDLFPIAFTLAGLALAIAWRDALSGRRGRGRLLAAALGLGVLAGLAVGSKLNGALLASMVGAWIPLAWLDARRETGIGFASGPLPALGVAGAACCALFLACNPALWPDPVAIQREILELWKWDIRYQQEELPHQDAYTAAEHFRLLWHGAVERDEPLRARFGLPGGAVLLFAGIAALALWSFRRRDAPRGSARGRYASRCALVYVAAIGLGQTAWLPFDRPSFFLPYSPAMALLEGVALAAAVAAAVAAVAALVARRRAPPEREERA